MVQQLPKLPWADRLVWVDKRDPITSPLSPNDQLMNLFKWLEPYIARKMRAKLFNVSLHKIQLLLNQRRNEHLHLSAVSCAEIILVFQILLTISSFWSDLGPVWLQDIFKKIMKTCLFPSLPIYRHFFVNTKARLRCNHLFLPKKF